MKTVLICAMDEEADGFRAALQHRKDRTICGLLFSEGTLCGQPVAVVRCNIGKVNAALCAQTAILEFAPDQIINVGVAGGVGDGVVTGHVVIATDTVQYDFDVSESGSEETLEFPCDPVLGQALADAAARVIDPERIHIGRIATGDRFVGNGDTAALLRNRYGALACEMEGGAVAHVCAVSGVRCAVLRAISDNANEQSCVDFPEFLAAAVLETEKILTAYFTAVGSDVC